ncbi:MAG: hypothetical protein WCH97_04140, partial [Actinomycetes bacterium]
MAKKISNFYFWGAGYLLLVFAVIALTTSRTSVSEVIAVEKVSQPLLCFNTFTSELRTSDTENGCIYPEESLGTEPINHTDIRPT